MTHKLIDALTDQEIKPGDKVKTFRGVEVTLVSFYTKPSPSSGRVCVKTSSGELVEYYPSVIGAQIKEMA